MSGSEHAFVRELEIVVETAIEAGEAVREMYDAASAETYIKGDGSPVTDADLAADRIVRERLGEAFPDDAILTEEGVDDGARLTNRRVWIVDPIDGTQQFIDRTGEFDVVIALAIDGEPVVAALYQPTEDRTLLAMKGAGAWVRVGASMSPYRFPDASDPMRVYTSVYFGAPESLPLLGELCDDLGAPQPGVSKWGVTPRELMEQGRYDALIGIFVPPRSTIAWEWDFAAPDLFTREAGGCFTNLDGERFSYNKPSGKNEGGLVMAKNPGVHQRVIAAIERCSRQ